MLDLALTANVRVAVAGKLLQRGHDLARGELLALGICRRGHRNSLKCLGNIKTNVGDGIRHEVERRVEDRIADCRKIEHGRDSLQGRRRQRSASPTHGRVSHLSTADAPR